MKIAITKFGLIGMLLATSQVFGGNPDRSGGAGATQLNINPYARSAGYGGANTASVRGIESFNLNIAGLAYTTKTDVAFSRMSFLQGSGVFINNFGLAQAVGENGDGGVIGLGFSSWDFGSIPITTFDNPDGTLPTFSPQVVNIGASYAKKFSNSITGGFLLRLISEGIQDVKAQGIAFDFGVQYQTALNPKKEKNKIKKEDFRLGISMRNIGPDITYRGSGLSFRAINSQTGADRKAYFSADKFNLPTLVNIGLGYDMRLDKSADTYFHRLTGSFNFNYNAFQSNVYGFGAEYAYKELAMLRVGYNVSGDKQLYSKEMNDPQYLNPVYGLWTGATFQLPISKNGTSMAIDYAYAPTRIFSGMHTVGIRLTVGGKKG
ncbi:MAG: PorV/PorQ family protein [Bacteroidia bacterium]|nr:PorV/PorQ family protein [Bacteroidia bacterium]